MGFLRAGGSGTQTEEGGHEETGEKKTEEGEKVSVEECECGRKGRKGSGREGGSGAEESGPG